MQLSVPPSLKEAARIDGASGFQIFWKITLPHLRPTIAANVILVLNGALRVYDIPRLLTMGGPVLSSETQALYMYKMAFTSMRYGYGSAVAMFIVAEALFLALVVKKLLKTEE